MRLGFDCDGVFADFNAAFIERVKQLTGRDLFPSGYVPTTWNYPESLGYLPEEVRQVWEALRADRTFWLTLPPYEGAQAQLERIRLLSLDHDVYFVTSRPGERAKHQTEIWLATHSGDFMWNPTVLIASDKAAIAKALDFHAYIDDRWENVRDVRMGTTAIPYLLDRPWNQNHVGSGVLPIFAAPFLEDPAQLYGCVRVPSVEMMLDRIEALGTARQAA